MAESTVLKKRRNDTDIIQKESINNNCKNGSTSVTIEGHTNLVPAIKCEFVEFLSESGIKLNPVAPHFLRKYLLILII